MSNYKEIVTKTILGKGRKEYTNTYNIKTEEEPDTVLGCWIINHKFNGTNNKNEINIKGSFDINVWYSYSSNSKTNVVTKNFTYEEQMRLRVKDYESLNNENEIIVRSLKQPTVQNVKIKDGIIELSVDKELGVEIIGEGKVKIAIEDDELPWDEIEEEQEYDIKDDYIKE